MVTGPAGQLAECRAKARSWSVVESQKFVGILLLLTSWTLTHTLGLSSNSKRRQMSVRVGNRAPQTHHITTAQRCSYVLWIIPSARELVNSDRIVRRPCPSVDTVLLTAAWHDDDAISRETWKTLHDDDKLRQRASLCYCLHDSEMQTRSYIRHR